MIRNDDIIKNRVLPNCAEGMALPSRQVRRIRVIFLFAPAAEKVYSQVLINSPSQCVTCARLVDSGIKYAYRHTLFGESPFCWFSWKRAVGNLENNVIGNWIVSIVQLFLTMDLQRIVNSEVLEYFNSQRAWTWINFYNPY